MTAPHADTLARAPKRTLPTSAKVRYLAPDVARGVALLGIAMANVVTAWLPGHANFPFYYGDDLSDPSVLDKVLVVFQTMFVHVRGLPMFSTLLGVGIGMITASQLSKGRSVKATRRLLWRRYAWLMVFGVLHAALLFWGDIMTAYGVIGLLMGVLISRSDRFLKATAVVVYIVASIAMLVAGYFLTGHFKAAVSEADLMPPVETGVPQSWDELGENLVGAVVGIAGGLLAALALLPIVLVGFLWGRSGVFADIDAHRRMLLRWVWVAVAVILLNGLPVGLAAVGVSPDAWSEPLFMLVEVVGVLTGPGILAAIALLVQPVQRQVAETGIPRWLYPVNALGKRSMSGYLMQSVIFVLVIQFVSYSYLEWMSIAEKMLLAVAVWLVTLVLATLLELAGLPGPFEWAHRRLSYREPRRKRKQRRGVEQEQAPVLTSPQPAGPQ
ncbi:hypothetical protein CGLAU_05255 [Corynebacterium glaucum]|uniref:DUF418 domain-containing protein n=1 Tax=Corynebacterium glaucum TaxID=187491 RepID=A0A1Q2HW13_9CORY|nr:DUF418 domain-containing protein [Corynebacterium glaucum]AQQ15022.1 hypothetical protein CGLAU_05255 [Corynebacterium glaucum]